MYYEDINTYPYQDYYNNSYIDERLIQTEVVPSMGVFPPITNRPPRPPFFPPVTNRPPFLPPFIDRPPFLPPSNIGRINRCLNRETLITLTNGFSFWFYPTYVSRNSVFGFRWGRNGWNQDSISLNSIVSVNCSR